MIRFELTAISLVLDNAAYPWYTGYRMTKAKEWEVRTDGGKPDPKLIRGRRLVIADAAGLTLCPVCRVWFAATRSNQVQCSTQCTMLSYRRRKAQS